MDSLVEVEAEWNEKEYFPFRADLWHNDCMNSHDIWTQEAKQLIIQSKQLREQSARLCAEYEMLVSGNGIAPSSLPLRKANR